MEQTKWYKNPEMIVALSALIIGLVTAFTSIYSAYVDRQYARAAVWPRLEIFRSFSDDSFSYTVKNSGTGPALIKYAKVRHDGKYVKMWEDIKTFQNFRQSHIGLRTLPPQTSVTPLSYKGEAASEFMNTDQKVSIELCYCSIYDECWLIDKRNEPQPIEECTVSEKESFFQ